MPLHYSSERHRFLPSKILLGRSCYLVSSSHFVILGTAFSNFIHQWWNNIREWNNSRRATNVSCLVSSFRGGRGRGGISRNFFSPHVIREYFLPSECLPFEYFKLFEVLYRRGEGGGGDYNQRQRFLAILQFLLGNSTLGRKVMEENLALKF